MALPQYWVRLLKACKQEGEWPCQILGGNSQNNIGYP